MWTSVLIMMAICVCWASPHLWSPDSCVQLLIWHCALDVNRNFQLEFQCTSLNNFHLTPNLFFLCIFLSLWKSPTSVTQKKKTLDIIHHSSFPLTPHHIIQPVNHFSGSNPKICFCLFVCFAYFYLIRSFDSWWNWWTGGFLTVLPDSTLALLKSVLYQ